MKIGLDYGGVISFSPDGWKHSIKNAKQKGHEFYIVSHVNPDVSDEHLKMRSDFADATGITNITFSDLHWSNKNDVGKRKASICQEYGIEIFIDDDLTMCQSVGKYCDRCAALYIPQNLWQIGQRIIDNLDNDNDW